MKPTYKSEISLGQILVVVSLLASLGLMEMPRASEIKVMQAEVRRHEEAIKQHGEISRELSKSQDLIASNLKVLTAIVEDHLKWDEVPGTGMKPKPLSTPKNE